VKKNSFFLVVALCLISAGRPALSDDCSTYWCGYAPFTQSHLNQFIRFGRLLNAPGLFIGYEWNTSANGWLQISYFENCAFYPGFNAWDLATDLTFTWTPVSIANIKVELVTDLSIWLLTGGSQTAAGHTGTVPTPYQPVDGVPVYINLAYYNTADYWWYGCSTPANIDPPHDMQSIITHEIGHALGFDDINEGNEGCSVMTREPGSPAWRVAIGPLDLAGVRCYYPPVAVGDIQSFGAVGSGHNVNLSFTLAANPQQSNAIYVSDNPKGPAQLISLLDPPGVLEPTVNHATDSYRLPPQGTYFYWMDHDVGGFASIRNPTGLRASSSVPTITSSPSGINRPVYDSPDILAVHSPAGVGQAEIIWQPSANNTSIDWYNVYRNSFPNGHSSQGEWVWLGKTTSNSSTVFVDLSADVGVTSEYCVSAAHHGTYAVTTGSANQGIWNEFSNTVSTVSGVIAVNSTWSGTVYVSGDVRVAQGVTLTVNPGTNVFIWPGDPNHALNTAAGGIDPNRCEIWVDGTLRAVGYQAQPIKFVAYDVSGPTSDNDAWYGFFVTSTGSATFHDCTIKNARYGIGAQGNVTLRTSLIQYAEKRGVSAAYNNSVSIRNSTIRDVGEYGINLAQNATLHIAQSTVRNVGINGIMVASGSTAQVDTVTFRDNATAIYIDRDSPSYTVSATVRGCTINHNDNGVYVNNEWTGAVRYCTIDSNSTTGVYLYATAGNAIERNKIRHNTVGIYVDGGNPLIRNENVIESNGAGLKCDHNAAPTVRRNKIASNNTGVVTINEGVPDLGVCDTEVPCDTVQCSTSGKNNISGSTTYHVMTLNQTTPVTAICNYWGTKVVASKFFGNVIYEPHLASNPVAVLLAMRPDLEEPRRDVPRAYDVSQNYPNPFNPATTIRYDVPAPGGPVEISVFDVAGHRVTTLVNDTKAPGVYTATWQGMNSSAVPVASGIYFVRMRANTFEKTRKLVLLK
jgi:parallel beta-helix repeat protein